MPLRILRASLVNAMCSAARSAVAAILAILAMPDTNGVDLEY
jgi:hypothetical protein